jgi:ABC-2 type transport system ATP-binding protein
VHQADLEAERSTNRRFVQLEVTGDDRSFAEVLRKIGAEGVSESAGNWRIILPQEIEIGVLWKLTSHEGLRITKLAYRRDSLEEIFLKAVGHLRQSPVAAAQEVPVHGGV